MQFVLIPRKLQDKRSIKYGFAERLPVFDMRTLLDPTASAYVIPPTDRSNVRRLAQVGVHDEWHIVLPQVIAQEVI